MFRTPEYRVFLASPYFNLDLEYEIRWHEKYLKKLKKHEKNPSEFHRELTSHKISQERIHHFKEQVIESIPFHNSVLKQHKKRLETMKNLIPLKKYKKLVKISLKVGGTPEYFVYDKKNKKSFFVVESFDEEKLKWMNKAKKVSEVIVLDQKH